MSYELLKSSSAVLPKQTHYSFYSSLLFSIKSHERVLFELCIAIPKTMFLVEGAPPATEW